MGWIINFNWIKEFVDVIGHHSRRLGHKSRMESSEKWEKETAS